MAWLLPPLRRALIALISLLLLTLPLFAWLRYSTVYCGRPHPLGLACDIGYLPSSLLDDSSWYYPFWQGGLPPHDYWPLGLAILGAAALFGLARTLSSRRSR